MFYLDFLPATRNIIYFTQFDYLWLMFANTPNKISIQ